VILCRGRAGFSNLRSRRHAAGDGQAQGLAKLRRQAARSRPDAPGRSRGAGADPGSGPVRRALLVDALNSISSLSRRTDQPHTEVRERTSYIQRRVIFPYMGRMAAQEARRLASPSLSELRASSPRARGIRETSLLPGELGGADQKAGYYGRIADGPSRRSRSRAVWRTDFPACRILGASWPWAHARGGERLRAPGAGSEAASHSPGTASRERIRGEFPRSPRIGRGRLGSSRLGANSSGTTTRFAGGREELRKAGPFKEGRLPRTRPTTSSQIPY